MSRSAIAKSRRTTVETAAGPSRRDLFAGLSAAIGVLLLDRRRGFAAGNGVFSAETVIAEAKALAAQPFAPPPEVPQALRDLKYDTYRQIRFRKDEAVWGGTRTRFSIELFAPGFLFQRGIDVLVVENGASFPIEISPDSFETPTAAINQALVELGMFAGFRLHYPLNRPDYEDEFVVFQGASYFRAVSPGQAYGLSARGLALNVAEPMGEEFPIFRRFWIERPSAKADSIVVHALLDSASVAGAYRFGIYPGSPTRVDVEATLFPRQPLTHVGLAPLTSMFLFGAIDGPDRSDYRPAVHDSLGLAMHAGNGERLWRPLSNPATLQVSAFVDANPKGFGLIQRTRRFDEFQDLEAAYERRPSAWVTPIGAWGEGHVQLVEIPSDNEINDNIVAYWRPKSPMEPGAPFAFAYRLVWPDDITLPAGMAKVVRSAYGLALTDGRPQVVIDYDETPGYTHDSITVDVNVSSGTIIDQVVHRNEATGGWRVFVTFDPGDAPSSEIRVQPKDQQGSPIGETWLYRWTSG